MSGLSFPIGLVKMKKNFYVIANPSMVELPREKKLPDSNINAKFEKACMNLWGEGTVLKVIRKSQNDFSLDKDIEIFQRQISIYENSCSEKQIEHEMEFHDIAEENMLSMGLPVFLCDKDKTVYDDVFIVMSLDMFEDTFMSSVNKAFPIMVTSYSMTSKKDVVEKVSKMFCRSKK